MKGCGSNIGKKFRLNKKVSGKSILRPKYTTVQKHVPQGILEAQKPWTFKSRSDEAKEWACIFNLASRDFFHLCLLCVCVPYLLLP